VPRGEGEGALVFSKPDFEDIEQTVVSSEDRDCS